MQNEQDGCPLTFVKFQSSGDKNILCASCGGRDRSSKEQGVQKSCTPPDDPKGVEGTLIQYLGKFW